MARRKRLKGLRARTPVAQAMAAILPPQVEAIIGYEEAARARDVDGIHDMRVATKRLREAARVFRPAFGKARMARHLAHLEALNNALGAVRELDVLGEQLQNLVARDPALEGGLQPLRDKLARQRDDADRALTPVLDETLPALRKDFRALLRDRCRKRRDMWQMPFAGLGRQSIAERTAAAFALEPAARAPGAVAEFHRMRIAIKRVKYALELFLDVLGKPGRKAYRPVTALQELMGLVHDCDVLLGLIAGAKGSLITASAARRAAKLVAEDRAKLRDQTLTLLDDMHVSRVCEKLVRKLR